MRTDDLAKYVQLRRQLTEERKTLQSRIEQIDEALGAIAPVSLSAAEGAAPNTGAVTGTKGKRTMSPEARARIAAAQKARWAKQKGGKVALAKPSSTASNGEAKPKRKMSAAGRRAISEAAKKRWAAAKASGKSGQ